MLPRRRPGAYDTNREIIQWLLIVRDTHSDLPGQEIQEETYVEVKISLSRRFPFDPLGCVLGQFSGTFKIQFSLNLLAIILNGFDA